MMPSTHIALRAARDFVRAARARRWARRLLIVSVLSAVLLLAGCTSDAHLTFLNPQGPVADAQRWHFYWVLAIMAILVAGPIFLVLPVFAWRYRYGNKSSKYTPKWEFSRLLEVLSWGGPVVIVVILSIFVWRDAHKLDPYKPLPSSQPALKVQVIGYDWKWLFIYPDQGIASIGTMAIPVGRPVSMQITSATVMQSFFIPALGSQIYAMGGMVSQLNLQADQPGRSLGENTMYNGNGFHQQKFDAVAMPPARFKAWASRVRTKGLPLDAHALKLIAQPGTRADLAKALSSSGARGKGIYLTGVSKSLFPAVVKATLKGQTELPSAAFGQAGTTLEADTQVARATAERQ